MTHVPFGTVPGSDRDDRSTRRREYGGAALQIFPSHTRPDPSFYELTQNPMQNPFPMIDGCGLGTIIQADPSLLPRNLDI